MENNLENTNRYSEPLFFIVLFLFFAFTFSGNSESKSSASTIYSLQYDLASGNISSRFIATEFNSVDLPELYKNCVSVLYNTSDNSCSFVNSISDFDRKSAQDYILIQKTRLAAKPLLPFRLYSHLPSNKDDNLPALS